MSWSNRRSYYTTRPAYCSQSQCFSQIALRASNQCAHCGKYFCGLHLLHFADELRLCDACIDKVKPAEKRAAATE